MVLDIVEKLKSRITAVEVVVVGRPIRSGCIAFLHIQVQVTLGNLYKVLGQNYLTTKGRSIGVTT